MNDVKEVNYDIEWYMKERVVDQIDWYSSRATTNKRWYRALIAINIVIAAMIPFATLYSDLSYTKYFIAFLGTLVTITSGIISTFQLQKKWIEYRTTSETLKHERYLFLSSVGPYSLKNKRALFIENIEHLISKENSKWAFYSEKISEDEDEE